jgi:FKBP-type peptidyl-prolyl cis-trans isomerase 2
MMQAKHSDTVKVHYTGKLEDGTIFDSSFDREPLEFTIGQEQVIPGFEQAVVGMNPGESKMIEIPAEQAYGPYRQDMVITVGRDQFPSDLEPEVGQRLQVRQADGQVSIVTVIQVDGDRVLLDANHPLAGQALTFEIELVDIDEDSDGM